MHIVKITIRVNEKKHEIAHIIKNTMVNTLIPSKVNITNPITKLKK